MTTSAAASLIRVPSAAERQRKAAVFLVNSILLKLWNSSPASITRAVARRLHDKKGRPGWFAIEAGPAAGAQLYLPHAASGGWRDMIEGKFDDFLYRTLRSGREVKGMFCWDIGAHIGYHSLGLAALGAQVLAFEPNKANATRFKEHLARNPELAKRIRLREEALSDCDGEVTFVQCRDISTGSSGSHLADALPPLEREAYRDLFENVKSRAFKIDTLVTLEKEPEPDLLKMDVEGGELLVLRGGIELLKRKKPLILMEVHHICLMFEIQQFLSRLGYRMEILDQEHASPSRCFVVAEAGS